MSEGWGRLEVEAIVADYFVMLEAELRGERINKTGHRRALMPQLVARGESSIEFKHANISAILIEAGFPYIAGYKPRSNYQSLLADVVLARLAATPSLAEVVAADAELVPEVRLPSVDELARVFVDRPERAPIKERSSDPRVPTYGTPGLRLPINYLEREARNRALGDAGEEFVVRVEQARLISQGLEGLASKIDHVARTQYDGLGYDILSFEVDGRERLIEVKTTKHGKETPFFVSRNELVVSQREYEQYQLYRVFDFRKKPKVFSLPGSLLETCSLDPENFRARAL